MKKLFVKILFLAILWYLFMTPEGALRLAVAVKGYPGEALTLRWEAQSVGETTGEDENQLLYALADPPREKETGEYLRNWTVTRYFLLYVGTYEGGGFRN